MSDMIHTLVLIFHVIGAALIVGVSFVSCVIEIKKYNSEQVIALLRLIWKITKAALGIQVLTGFYLAFSEWDTVGHSPYFWLKLFLFFVIGSIVGTINRRRMKAMQSNAVTGQNGTTWELIGLLVFITITALGVLTAETAAS